MKSKKSLCKSRIEVDRIATQVIQRLHSASTTPSPSAQVCVATTIGVSSGNSDDAHDDGKVISLYKFNKGVS